MNNGDAIFNWIKTVYNLYRTTPLSSFEVATELSNEWTKNYKEYNTAVRVEIEGKMEWIITNEFDPDVAAEERKLSELGE